MKRKSLLLTSLLFTSLFASYSLSSCSNAVNVASASIKFNYNQDLVDVKINNEKETYNESDIISLDITVDSKYALDYVTLNEEKVSDIKSIKLDRGMNVISIYIKALENIQGSTNLRDFTFNKNSDETYSITGYYPSGNVPSILDIPSSYLGKKVKSIDFIIDSTGASLSNYSFSMIDEIHISENIETINAQAFMNTQSIKKYSVDENNKYFTSVGDCLFSKDQKTLISAPRNTNSDFKIPESTETIAKYAFYKNLNIINPVFNENLKVIEENAFEGCNSLRSVHLKNNVTTIKESAFKTCSVLDDVILSTSLTELNSYVFRDCGYLREIEIPGSVKKIHPWAFFNDLRLKNVTFNEGIEELLSSSFSYTGVKNVILPSTIRTLGSNCFTGCDYLENITLNEGLEEIGDYCFNIVKLLEKINIPSTVKTIGKGAFTACLSLTSFDVSSSNPNFASVDGVLFSKDLTSLIAYPSAKDVKEYTIPSTVTKLAFRCFNYVSNNPYEEVYECFSVEKVIIPTSVVTFENPFYGALLKNVTYLGNVDDFKALDTTYVYDGETYDWYSGSVFKTLHCLDGDITYE